MALTGVRRCMNTGMKADEAVQIPLFGEKKGGAGMQVLRDSGVTASEVCYVEAHGTGTVAGELLFHILQSR